MKSHCIICQRVREVEDIEVPGVDFTLIATICKKCQKTLESDNK